MQYFSDAERGPRSRNEESIPQNVWGGIISLINVSIYSGAFGKSFPVGGDSENFRRALQSEIPDIVYWPLCEYEIPGVLAVLDLIQFCYRHISKPITESIDHFSGRHEIRFDVAEGQNEFRQKINLIFARNGLIYDLQEDGSVIRKGPPVLREILIQKEFDTGEQMLNEFLTEACREILDPDAQIRGEAVERLWDAWNRLKTIDTHDKKDGIKALLDCAASEEVFRQIIERDASELTKAGDNLRIRHSETNKPEIERPYQNEYLFYRLLNLVWLILQARNVKK